MRPFSSLNCIVVTSLLTLHAISVKGNVGFIGVAFYADNLCSSSALAMVESFAALNTCQSFLRQGIYAIFSLPKDISVCGPDLPFTTTIYADPKCTILAPNNMQPPAAAISSLGGIFAKATTACTSTSPVEFSSTIFGSSKLICSSTVNPTSMIPSPVFNLVQNAYDGDIHSPICTATNGIKQEFFFRTITASCIKNDATHSAMYLTHKASDNTTPWADHIVQMYTFPNGNCAGTGTATGYLMYSVGACLPATPAVSQFGGAYIISYTGDSKLEKKLRGGNVTK